ncbi:alpha-beta hydrolase superfamily lysophospholipase [Rhodovulum bhavnagarense]|uniref:Alpha-beta hydrolase superfamily lysophospholipase n=1 Tax=Rhodovulum bhavnagarense TaxID=992286 RepID=A0A4R2RDS0_9RHOB|nr:alpha/beta hydrolase [Rhodovulum bhavnagarense]TCP60953.1 alpha-beta hydrolase superfamily lysophospholipase [Rhodovulum bhavnagarense]
MIWGLFVAIAGLVILAWPLSEWRRRPMDRAARDDAPGQIADLPSGATHYRWNGPVRGQVAVCLHGLTTGNYILEDIAANLARMGFRVLRYDLYGRGYSDRPRGAQDRAFFLRQLEEMLDHAGIEAPFTLVGYSMGGALATAFAADHPHRVTRLVLLASAGLGHTAPPLPRLTQRLPVVGDWLARVTGGWQLRHMTRQAARIAPLPPALVEAQIAETRYRGFIPAVLSSMRHMLAADFAPDHGRIARAGVPVLAVWAGEDELILPTAPGRLAKLNRTAQQHGIAGASHALVVTHAPEIHLAIQGFVRDT